MKEDHELVVGGPLMAEEVADFTSMLFPSGVRFIRKGALMRCLNSATQQSVASKMLFSKGSHLILPASEAQPRSLLRWLEAHRLDFGYRTTRTVVFFDGRRRRKNRFHQLHGKILLSLPEAQDPARCAEAASWDSWAPRPLFVCDSQHQRIGATFA